MSDGGQEHDVFVSYASADRPAVAELATALRHAGLDIWIDTSGLDDFGAITATVAAALARSKAIVVCLSPVYLTRAACQWELCQAFTALAGQDVQGRVLVVQIGSQPPDTGLGVLRDLRIMQGGDWSVAADVIARQVAALAGVMGARPEVSVPSWPRPALTSPSFTGRFPELLSLYRLLSPRADIGSGRTGAHVPVVVAGMGGTGKTMLVEEYAARFPARYPGGVIRLSGRNETIDRFAADPDEVLSSLLQQLRALAQAWGAPDQEQGGALRTAVFGAREAVRGRLAGGGAVLWIVDDLPPGLAVEDFSLFLCPDPDVGVTAITSRTSDYGGLAEVLELDCLASVESVALLATHRRPASGAEAAAAEQIAQALGGHPLALDATGARLKRGVTGYADVARRLTGDAALHEYEGLARSFRGELPTGHEVSIVTTLSDSVTSLSTAAARGLQFAAICDPGFAVPVRWASAVLFTGQGGQETQDSDWLTDEGAIEIMSAGLEEITAAHLAKTDGTSYLTHVLVAAVTRHLLREEDGEVTEMRIRRAALRWLAAGPPVLVSPVSPVSETVAVAIGWHGLALLDEAVRRWEDSPADLRQDIATTQYWLGYLFDNTGAEWLQKESTARFARALLTTAMPPGRQAIEILTDLAGHDDLDPLGRARIRERVVSMTEAVTGDDSPEVASALKWYIGCLREVPLPGLAQAAEQRLTVILERQAAQLEAAEPGGNLIERLSILQQLSATLQTGDPDRTRAVRYRLLRLVDGLGAALSDPAIPVDDRLRAYSEMTETFTPLDPPMARASARAIVGLLRPVFDQKVSAGASREDLDTIVRSLATALRILGDQQSIEEIYELRDRSNSRPEEQPSTWRPGDPVDSAEGIAGIIAEISAIEQLRSTSPEEALARMRRITEEVLMAPEEENALRKARLLWRIDNTIHGGWGAPGGDPAEWDEIRETVGDACVETALEYARSMQEHPDYLGDLYSLAELLMGTAIGGKRGLLTAAELYQTLAGRLAAGQGEFANQTLAAWEKAAESLDRADLDDDGIQERSREIRLMLAGQYRKAFDLELQDNGLGSPKAQFYLSGYLDYLRNTGQNAELLDVGGRVYRQAVEEYGDGSETAEKVLGTVAGYAPAADILEQDPG